MSRGEKFIPEAVRKGDKFLSPEELKGKVLEWEKAAQHEHGIKDYETGHEYTYYAKRVDSEGQAREGDIGYVDTLHNLSFISYIEEKLKTREPKEGKFKILDVGGGAGLFAQQLRKKFGDRVDVYTTGLRKKSARELIKKNKNIESDSDHILHPHDLKWRSIEQLADFSEFDLIVDTWGEALYTKSDLRKYFFAVISKLNHGGFASITVNNLRTDEKKKELVEYLQSDSRINFEIINSVVRINKK